MSLCPQRDSIEVEMLSLKLLHSFQRNARQKIRSCRNQHGESGF